MKKYILTLIILTVVILAAIGAAQAATYYVDYLDGNDANRGISQTDAWKHAPGDSEATGIVKSTILRGGDTVIFKGGVIYSGTGISKTLITISSSGTANNYITYDGNSAGTWGTGRAKIDLINSYYHAFLDSSGHNYIKILNFDIYNAKNTNSGAGLTGSCAGQIKVTRGGIDQCVTYTGTYDPGVIKVTGSHWLINGNVMHDAENYTDLCVVGAEQDTDNSTTTGTPAQQVWIWARGPGVTDIEISNNEFYAAGDTIIYLYGTDSVSIKNNNFGGINRDAKTGYFSVAIRIGASAGTPDSGSKNVTISNNIFHDGWQYEGDDAGGQRCHAGDWIHVYGAGAAVNDNIIYDSNLFYNDMNFLTAHGSAMSQVDTVTNFYVRNNIFINPHATNGAVNVVADVENYYAYNNLIITYLSQVGMGLNGARNAYIKNNIGIINDKSGASVVFYRVGTTTPPTESDNNVYYIPNKGNAWKFGSGYFNLSQWQSSFGLDQHSYSENPHIAFVPASGAVSSSGDYRLTAQSDIAIDKGATVNNSFDFIGTPRPQGAAWDIGAYEYVPAYYIRAGAPAGGDGSDWNSAWNSLQAIVWSKIKPGTTIWIAGGQYGILKIQSSGNASNRIYIKRATASDPNATAAAGWDPSFDSQVVMDFVYDSNGSSYWTLDGVIPYTGIQVRNTSALDYPNDSYSISLGNTPANYVELKNLDVTGQVDNNYPSILGGEKRCLNFNNYISGRDTAYGLYIGYCQFHNADTLVSAIGIDGMTVEHNKFYGNYHTNNHHPNIWQTAGASNVIFRHNEVYNWQGEGIMMDFTSPSDRPNVNWYIYGNIWHDAMPSPPGSGCSYSCARILATQYRANGPIYLFNNTFVNLWIPITLENGGTWDSGSQGRNNLYWNLISGGPRFPDEANNIVGSGTTNTPFLDYANKDYRLKAGSSAINAGAALAPINGISFNTDMAGNTRGADGAWDIGAYEYVSTAVSGDLSGDGAISAYDAALVLQLGRGELEAGQIAQKAVGD